MKVLYFVIISSALIFSSEPPKGSNAKSEIPQIGQRACADMEMDETEDIRPSNQKLLEQKILEGYLNSVGFELVDGKIQNKS